MTPSEADRDGETTNEQSIDKSCSRSVTAGTDPAAADLPAAAVAREIRAIHLTDHLQLSEDKDKV